MNTKRGKGSDHTPRVILTLCNQKLIKRIHASLLAILQFTFIDTFFLSKSTASLRASEFNVRGVKKKKKKKSFLEN